MIFKPELAQAIVTGLKTQSRRLIGEWDQAEYDTDGNICRVIAWPSAAHKLAYSAGRTRYQVGKTYSVQSGRGQKAVARIRLTAIRRERVNEISEADMIEEGVIPWPTKQEFALLWDYIHGPGSFASGPEVWVLVFEIEVE